MTSPIIGYRAWTHIKLDGEWRLQSIISKTLWTPHEPLGRVHYPNVAQMVRENKRGWGWLLENKETNDTEHYEENCICGIYAYRAWDYPGDYYTVLGTVALWGEVELHAGGYRAQYAYPLSLERLRCLDCGSLTPHQYAEDCRWGCAETRKTLADLRAIYALS